MLALWWSRSCTERNQRNSWHQGWPGSSGDRQLLVNHPLGNLTCWSVGTRLVGAGKAQISSFSSKSQVVSFVAVVVG
ncbi:hypothetical protein NL676_023083 [Syzygium grande]|nr:hypothetical protein NL676_023083 [Syzygium grande]